MKRALLFVTLLAASLLSIVVTAPAAAAATCQTPFATAGYPAGWTQIKDKPDTWSQTDGNVITAEAFGSYVAIGGNFTKVTAPGRASVPAQNLAVLRASTGEVVWAAASMTGYPRTMAVRGGVLYIGGSFTALNGVARKAVLALDAATFALRPWAPVVDGGTIRDIQVSAAGVAYLAGNGSVAAFRTDNAQRIWSAPAANGVVRALLLSPDETGLFAGGDFNKLAGTPANQLAEIYPVATGKVYLPFVSHLRPNSTPTSRDGELVLELRWDAETHLIVGRGGAGTNGLTSVAPWDGGHFWSYDTEGDTQGLAILGNTVLQGQHRSHGNLSGCPYNYFGNQWANHDFEAFVLPWNPGLNNGTGGKSTPQSVQSEANGGISDIVIHAPSRKVYVVGDFTGYGGTCDYASLTYYFVPCTGSVPLRGIARYSY